MLLQNREIKKIRQRYKIYRNFQVLEMGSYVKTELLNFVEVLDRLYIFCQYKFPNFDPLPVNLVTHNTLNL